MIRTADLVAAEAEEAEDEEEEQAAAPEPVEPSGIGAVTAAALTELVPIYGGPLEPLRTGVEAFLIAEGLDPARTAEGGAEFIDSLLATAEENMGLDWIQRESLQARLKVACKRVLVQFGLHPRRRREWQSDSWLGSASRRRRLESGAKCRLLFRTGANLEELDLHPRRGRNL
jgi:hypothetical protein